MQAFHNSSRNTADKIFQMELANRDLPYEVTEDGLYRIQIGEVAATVNLENVRRNYERDKDAGAIVRFARQLDVDLCDSAPDWKDVQSRLRFSLEPSDYESGFDDTLLERITDDLVRLFVFVSPDGSRISWIANSMLTSWQVSRETIAAYASANMNQLVADASLELYEIDGIKLGMLCTEETAFKASLILADRFCELVKPTHGWPVYVVAPARDFVYVLSRSDRGFLGRLGAVVLDEYARSGYPVTQDVLEVGDAGVTAIGTFAPRDA
jgi:hypothetical protein